MRRCIHSSSTRGCWLEKAGHLHYHVTRGLNPLRPLGGPVTRRPRRVDERGCPFTLPLADQLQPARERGEGVKGPRLAPTGRVGTCGERNENQCNLNRAHAKLPTMACRLLSAVTLPDMAQRRRTDKSRTGRKARTNAACMLSVRAAHPTPGAGRHVCNTGGVTCPTMHLVSPGLYLGSALAARDVELLRARGVQAVLSIGGGDSDASQVRAVGAWVRGDPAQVV